MSTEETCRSVVWLEQEVTCISMQPVLVCMPVDLMWLYMHCSVAVRIEYTVALAAMFARSTQGSVSTHTRPVHVNAQTVCTVNGRGACGMTPWLVTQIDANFPAK